MTKTTMALCAVGFIALGALGALGADRFLFKPQDPRDGMETIAALKDWRLTCPPRTTKKGICIMQSGATQSGTKSVLAELTVAPKDNGDALTVVTPLGVYIPPGIKVSVGAAETKAVAFKTCVQMGCIAILPIDSGLASALSQNAGGQLTVVTVDGKPVSLNFSLRGYTDALAARAVDTAARQ